MAKPRKLSPQESNRLAVLMQLAKINFIKTALGYVFNGKSTLWGQEVDTGILKREQLKLVELHRIKEIHETTAYKKLPYIASGGSNTEKIKEHYLKGEGVVGFVEVKENSHGQSVVNHLLSKRTIKRMIKKSQQSSKLKQKQMATKKRTTTKPVDEDLLGFDPAEIDEMLEGIESKIPVYKITDKVQFMFAGEKKTGHVLKALSEGKIKVVDAGATVYMVKPIDIIKRETAAQVRKGKEMAAYEWDEEKGHTVPKGSRKKTTEPVVPVKASKSKSEPVKKTKAKGGEPTQRELVEALAEKGERDYDKIAAKTGVTRTNVGQYMYRWKKANPKKA